MAIEMIPEDQPQTVPPPSFAEYLPEDAMQFSGEPSPIATPEDAESGGVVAGDAAPPRKRIQMSKKMKKSMDKFMRQIAEMPALYFTNMAASNQEWALDDDEKELLTDSVSMVFEILDVGFEIEPLSLKLTSIWWIISYPFIVFGYIFFNKKQKIDADKEPEL